MHFTTPYKICHKHKLFSTKACSASGPGQSSKEEKQTKMTQQNNETLQHLKAVSVVSNYAESWNFILFFISDPILISQGF